MTIGYYPRWCCPESVYDPLTKTVVLQFSNATVAKGGCDIGAEILGGILQIKSTDEVRLALIGSRTRLLEY